MIKLAQVYLEVTLRLLQVVKSIFGGNSKVPDFSMVSYAPEPLFSGFLYLIVPQIAYMVNGTAIALHNR